MCSTAVLQDGGAEVSTAAQYSPIGESMAVIDGIARKIYCFATRKPGNCPVGPGRQFVAATRV